MLRWRADATRDDTGHWIYIKDLDGRRTWSAAYQPTCATPESYRATFAADRVVFARRDGMVETHTEIVVVASEQAEIRRVTLVNRSRRHARHRADELRRGRALSARRPTARIRRFKSCSSRQSICRKARCWPAAGRVPRRGLAVVRPRCIVRARTRWGVTCETDRARFLGRGRSAQAPRALDPRRARCRAPSAAFSIHRRLCVSGCGSTRSLGHRRVHDGGGGHARRSAATRRSLSRQRGGDRALSLARTEAEVELRDLDIDLCRPRALSGTGRSVDLSA